MISILHKSAMLIRHITSPLQSAVCRELPQRIPLGVLSRSLAAKANLFRDSKKGIKERQKVKPLMTKNKVRSEEEANEFIRNLTDAQQKIHKFLQAEYDYLFGSLGSVPMKVTNSMWAEMIEIFEQGVKSSGRQKHWRWLTIKEHQRSSRKKRSIEVQEASQQPPPEPNEEPLEHENRIYYYKESTKQNYEMNKIFHAQNFGRQIVFDCGFEDTMGMQELRSLTRQLLKAHYYNRELDDPFFFSFCNIEPDSNIWALLQKFHSNQTGQTFDGYSQLPYHFSPRNFTDIFPREDLVMLSPDAKQSMYEVRSDKVYIIGAITDKASSKPLTMSKAKRLGIPCMKLPLHLLKWKGPRKDLGLDVVLQILQMVNEGSAWEDALNHCLPQRYLQRADRPEWEEKLPRVSKNSIILY